MAGHAAQGDLRRADQVLAEIQAALGPAAPAVDQAALLLARRAGVAADWATAPPAVTAHLYAEAGRPFQQAQTLLEWAASRS